MEYHYKGVCFIQHCSSKRFRDFKAFGEDTQAFYRKQYLTEGKATTLRADKNGEEPLKKDVAEEVGHHRGNHPHTDHLKAGGEPVPFGEGRLPYADEKEGPKGDEGGGYKPRKGGGKEEERELWGRALQR